MHNAYWLLFTCTLMKGLDEGWGANVMHLVIQTLSLASLQAFL